MLIKRSMDKKWHTGELIVHCHVYESQPIELMFNSSLVPGLNFLKSEPLSVHPMTRDSSPMLGCVVLYISTYTGHPCNFSYGASLVSVDGILCGIHYSAIFIHRRPTRCIIPATSRTVRR